MENETKSPNVKHYNAEDVVRLKKLVAEGCQVLREIDDLQSGLKDTIKSIAEEIEVKPAQLTKVIKIAHKQNFHEEQDKFEQIEDLLRTVGQIK
jgi:hypothetical protein